MTFYGFCFSNFHNIIYLWSHILEHAVQLFLLWHIPYINVSINCVVKAHLYGFVMCVQTFYTQVYVKSCILSICLACRRVIQLIYRTQDGNRRECRVGQYVVDVPAFESLVLPLLRTQVSGSLQQISGDILKQSKKPQRKSMLRFASCGLILDSIIHYPIWTTVVS